MEKPKFEKGQVLTTDTFNNIYDTIETETDKINEECNKLKQEYDKEIYNFRLELMNFQDEQTSYRRYMRFMYGLICSMGFFILLLLLFVILGVL